MVRLALVGVGGYGWQICGAIRQAAAEGKCKLVGAADVRLADMPLRAQELAAEGVELFDDALDMFARLRGRCDAVYICAGVPSHLPLTAAAATAGYHIHLEKPPAATVQEADQIANVVERAGVLCTLGFHGVYGQTMRFIKDRLVSGNLGRIRSLTAWALLPRPLFYYKRNDWAGKLKLGGQWVLDGPATNAMSHEINAMLFLSGRTPAGYATPKAVRGELYAAWPIDGHDTAAIEIRTAEGPVALFYGTHCCAEVLQPRIAVDCDAARATWTAERASIDYADGSSEQLEPDRTERQEMVAAFVGAVADGDPSRLLSTPAEGRKTVAVINGAHESSGRIHRVPADCTRRIDEGGDRMRIVIDGIEDYIWRALPRYCLFSDLKPAPPWSAATELFDLAGYASFPKRFRGD